MSTPNVISTQTTPKVIKPLAAEAQLPKPWVAIVLVVAVYLSSIVLAQLLVSIYPALKHWTATQAEDWLTNNTGVQFGYTLLAYGLMAAPFVWYLKAKGLNLKSVGVRRIKWLDAGMALLVLPGYFVAYGVLLTVVSKLTPSVDLTQKQQIGFTNAQSVSDLVLTFISLAIVPPLIEEFVMRGFLFTSLRAHVKIATAVVLTSFVFALGHLQFGSGAPPLWTAAIDTFTLSLFLIFLRVYTNGIWASVLLHMAKNSIAYVALFIFHKG